CSDYAERYPDVITLLINSSNLGLIKNYKRCFDECYGDYIAILEGDDYWIDEYKLQKQYDKFKNDSDAGLVHSNYKIYNENQQIYFSISHKIGQKSMISQGHNQYPQILKSNFICAATAMFRRSVLDDIDFDYFAENK